MPKANPVAKHGGLPQRAMPGILVTFIALLLLFGTYNTLDGVLPLTSCCCAQSVAQSPAITADTVEKRRTAGEVLVDRSFIVVHVRKKGFGHDHAIMGRIKEGAIHLGTANNSGSIVFDMNSFKADTEQARRYVGLEGVTDDSTQRQVTANMLGKDVLDVKHFSQATFTIESAQAVAQKSPRDLPMVQLDGKFTLHGVTQPLQLLAESEAKDNAIHLVGQFSILQTTYGIKPFKKAFGAVGVADQLTIWGDLWLETAPLEKN